LGLEVRRSLGLPPHGTSERTITQWGYPVDSPCPYMQYGG
jgi:hypothetical protein